MKEFDGGKLASMVQIIMSTLVSQKITHFKTGEIGTLSTFGNFIDPNTNTIVLGSKNSLA